MGRKLFLVPLFSVILFMGCDKLQQKAGSVDDSMVLVKIGNSMITVKEFERKFNTVPPQYKMFFAGEDGKKKFLDEIIKEKVLAEKAKDMGIDKKEDIKEIIEDIKSNILAKELYSLKNEEFTKSTNVTDEEIEKEIKTSDSIAHASHILLKDESKAKEILNKIKKGEDFSKLAREFSEDPSAKENKGDLGTFTKGDMVPEFDKAIFALKVGEVTPDPVKTSFGYHIIKRTEPGKEEIKSRLLSKKQNSALNNWLEDLKKQFPAQINEEVLKKLNVGKEEGQGMMMPHGGGMPQGHGKGEMPEGH